MTWARWVLRVTFLVQLLLGIGLWTGSFDVVKPVHIAVGVLFVLAMWTIAALALQAGGNRGHGGAVLAWGALLVVFGLIQEGIVPGALHWTTQVLHVVVALAAIAMTEALARRTPAAPAAAN